jgi:hypothetical protein
MEAAEELDIAVSVVACARAIQGRLNNRRAILYIGTPIPNPVNLDLQRFTGVYGCLLQMPFLAVRLPENGHKKQVKSMRNKRLLLVGIRLMALIETIDCAVLEGEINFPSV